MPVGGHPNDDVESTRAPSDRRTVSKVQQLQHDHQDLFWEALDGRQLAVRVQWGADDRLTLCECECECGCECECECECV
jgi:hypothetical protein